VWSFYGKNKFQRKAAKFRDIIICKKDLGGSGLGREIGQELKGAMK